MEKTIILKLIFYGELLKNEEKKILNWFFMENLPWIGPGPGTGVDQTDHPS